MSWAAIAKTEPAKVAIKEEGVAVKPRIAVVDANAIISGDNLLSLMRFNDRVVTIPEVMREVRDKQSRETLQNLPYTIQTQEPSEESLKAVMRFARATGDVHALSAVDARLLALAHTLEVSYYGSAHLRTSPAPPKVAKKKARDSKHLPGWGAEGGEWAELDKLNEEELVAAEAALMAGQTSRIATVLQELTLGGPGSTAGASDADALHITLRPLAQQEQQEGQQAVGSTQQQQQQQESRPAGEEAAAPAANGMSQAAAAAAQPAEAAEAGATGGAEGASGSDSEGDSESDDEEKGGDDGWVTAARTKNVQRRQRRREIRYAQRQAAAAEAAAAEVAAEEESEGDDYTTASSSDEEEGEEEGSGSEGEGQGEEQAVGREADAPSSSVCSVTADFAMQNVLLQMGLRLVTPDGRRISQLSRWVLRCAACFAVTKEMGRLFCPRCGNAAMDKVRVVVGPDGTEQYGVRKKHILRGTKFSLPKPKGGRYNDVILREDQLLAKMHRLRKKKSAQEELDPFAPEYTDETWHQAAALPNGGKGAAALLAGWKHNPNERKHIATNRRRK